MIWMIQQISIYILCYLFICLLIGSILFLIWKILCKKIEEKGFVRLNYGLLKIVILFFFDSFSNCNLKDGSLGWNYLFGK